MNNQWTSIHQMFHSPRKGFQSLPSDRLYIMAWLGPFLYGVMRNLRWEGLSTRRAALGGDVGIVVVTIVLGLFLVPFSCWLIRQFVKLFGKRLSVYKIMNIWGHALVPRLTFGIPAFLLMRAFPFKFILMPGERSLPLFCFAILQLIMALYTLFLFIYGLTVAPSEDAGKGTASADD